MTAEQLTPKSFKIYPNTERVKAQTRLELQQSLFAANYALKHALSTCRVSGGVEMTVRALSGYQYAKMVLDFHNAGLSGNEASRWLEARFAQKE